MRRLDPRGPERRRLHVRVSLDEELQQVFIGRHGELRPHPRQRRFIERLEVLSIGPAPVSTARYASFARSRPSGST